MLLIIDLKNSIAQKKQLKNAKKNVIPKNI